MFADVISELSFHDESDRSAARFDATAAYESAKGLLNRSPFPITEPGIQEKMRRLESAIGSYLLGSSS